MSFTTLYYIVSFSFLPIAVSVVIGWWKFQPKTRESWLVLLTTIALVSELLSSALWREKINNIPISHLYTLIEFGFLVLYFSSFFQKKTMRLLRVLPILFGGITIWVTFINSSPLSVNPLPRTIEAALLILISLYMYVFILRNPTNTDIWKQPLFWVNSAVLIYFSSSVLLFYFSNYVANIDNGLSKHIWLVHLVFMTIYYTLISIGLWKTPPTQRY